MRIICLALVVTLAVTSLLTMFPSLFQDESDAYTFTLEDLVAMGLIELDAEGNIVSMDESLFVQENENHEGHDHE